MSKEPTIEQMNEVIVLFMGGSSIKQHGWKRYVYYPESCAREITELEYHSSWDWLMPVVQKIEGMNWCVRVENWPKCFPTPYKELYSVWMWLNPEDAPEIQTYSDVKIKAVHIAVYQFIQWYKNQSTTTNDTTTGTVG